MYSLLADSKIIRFTGIYLRLTVKYNQILMEINTLRILFKYNKRFLLKKKNYA